MQPVKISGSNESALPNTPPTVRPNTPGAVNKPSGPDLLLCTCKQIVPPVTCTNADANPEKTMAASTDTKNSIMAMGNNTNEIFANKRISCFLSNQKPTGT